MEGRGLARGPRGLFFTPGMTDATIDLALTAPRFRTESPTAAGTPPTGEGVAGDPQSAPEAANPHDER